MSSFLWLMFGMFAMDLCSRFVSISRRKFPEETWESYTFNGCINFGLFLWIAYLLATNP